MAQPIAAAPVPFNLPKTLLLTSEPVSRILEAAGELRARGFDGVIASFDELRPDESLADRRGRISDAIARLRQAGLEFNFIRFPITEDRPYFTRREARDAILAQASAHAALAESCGFVGIAFDMASDALVFDPRWDGYAPEQEDLAALERRAEHFGSQIAREGLLEFPNAEVLIRAGPLGQAGPLWTPFVRGIAAGVRRPPRRAAARLHLLCPGPARADDIARLPRSFEHLRTAFSRLVDPADARRERCSLGFLIQPPVFRGDVASDDAALGDWREIVFASKLLSEAYLVVESLLAPWLALAVRPVQAGPARIEVSSPIDGRVRVGMMDGGFVLRTERPPRRAELAVLGGSAAAFDKIRDADSLEVRLIRSNTVKKPGEVDFKSLQESVLIGALPIHQWATPAGLWFYADEANYARITTLPVRFGWENRTGLGFTGVLTLRPPENWSFSEAVNRIDLDDGGGAVIAGTLRGKGKPGQTLDISLTLSSATGRPVTRTCRVFLPPERLWETQPAAAGGPVAFEPLAADLDGDRALEIVVATRAAELACLTADGKIEWRNLFYRGIAARPCVVRHWSGESDIAIVDEYGVLRLIRADGSVRWEQEPAQPAAAGGIVAVVAAELNAFPGDEIAIAQSDGRVVAFLSNGMRLWERLTDDGIAAMARVRGPERFDHLALWTHGAVQRWSGDGSLAARAAPPRRVAPLAAQPVVADDGATAPFEIVFALADGGVYVWNGTESSPRLLFKDPTSRPPTSILIGDPSENVCAVVSDGTRVFGVDPKGSVPWTIGIEGASQLTAIPAVPRCFVFFDIDGRLVCCSMKGEVLWIDGRSSGPVLVAPHVTNLGDPIDWACIVPTADSRLRAVRVPR